MGFSVLMNMDIVVAVCVSWGFPLAFLFAVLIHMFLFYNTNDDESVINTVISGTDKQY